MQRRSIVKSYRHSKMSKKERKITDCPDNGDLRQTGLNGLDKKLNEKKLENFEPGGTIRSAAVQQMDAVEQVGKIRKIDVAGPKTELDVRETFRSLSDKKDAITREQRGRTGVSAPTRAAQGYFFIVDTLRHCHMNQDKWDFFCYDQPLSLQREFPDDAVGVSEWQLALSRLPSVSENEPIFEMLN